MRNLPLSSLRMFRLTVPWRSAWPQISCPCSVTCLVASHAPYSLLGSGNRYLRLFITFVTQAFMLPSNCFGCFIWHGMHQDIGLILAFHAKRFLCCKVHLHYQVPIKAIPVPAEEFTHEQLELVGPFSICQGLTHFKFIGFKQVSVVLIEIVFSKLLVIMEVNYPDPS